MMAGPPSVINRVILASVSLRSRLRPEPDIVSLTGYRPEPEPTSDDGRALVRAPQQVDTMSREDAR